MGTDQDKKRHPHPVFHVNVFLLLVCLGVALLGALPRFGWNDGSRLATVECLVDFHTWQIDQSLFRPYTGDKMLIDGHFYSDKSPVPALAMAVVYKAFQWTMDLKAARQPNLFCFLMALCFSGSAYVISVLCLDRLAVRAGLAEQVRWVLVASFAFGTIALTYSRACNINILMLAVFALLFVLLSKCAEPGWEKFSPSQLCAMGTLLGAGYSIDLGAGPVLVIATVVFLSYRTRSLRQVIIVLAVAFPWFALHHALNYMIGGTFFPASTVPRYFMYPGSQLVTDELTGEGWAHHSLADFFAYSFDLLGGSRGFIVHNLVLFLAIPAAVAGLSETKEKRSLVYLSIGLIMGVWLLYAATSNNYSGGCCSVRWFVPLLIPFYYVLILALKRYPSVHLDLAILAGWSIVLGILLWTQGPWSQPMMPALGYVNAAAFITWLFYRGCRMWAGLT